MSYYEIDAILTDAEKVPCTFELDVPDLGHLDNTPAHSLKAGTQVNLPLWLSEMLAIANTGPADDDGHDSGSRFFVTLNLPPALGADVISALKADARAVPLRDQSAHFYALAVRMLDLFDERELGLVVRQSFLLRAVEVALHARKAGGVTAESGKRGQRNEGAHGHLGVGGTGEEFLRGLDELERGLFRRAHDGVKAGKRWMEGVKRR